MAVSVLPPLAPAPAQAVPDKSSQLLQQQQQPPLDPPPPPQQPCSSSSYSSSPRQFPSDLPDPILEEGGESGSVSPIEPVTPVSGRHSQDFALHHPDPSDVHHSNHPAASPTKAPLVSAAESAPRPIPGAKGGARNNSVSNILSNSIPEPETPAPLSRRSTRGSTNSFKRTMSNLFRRSNSQVKESAIVDTTWVTPSDSTLTSGGKSQAAPKGRSPSTNVKSLTTTRSNSPPSPGSPLEMVRSNHTLGSAGAVYGTVPEPDDFKKKSRASTGLTLRGRAVNFVGSTVGRGGGAHRHARRASSFDASNRTMSPHPPKRGDEHEQMYPPERLPWPLPPDAGTGAKARRMSLNLPDDFFVDVAELLSEYEYQSVLGRHGKHLGKGVASKVTLMQRKGYAGEFYAVKEFRGKSHRESQEEYEKKIKSEFSIAKSLHHPNIVETIRLCTDHSRFNHVMEYCSEGDLFSLVQKGHLKGDDRKKDRLCLFKQLIQGVGYLHANGIAHRDIKLENLLVTKDSKLKITDFGVSEVFCGTHPGVREAGGQCGQNMGEIRLCSPGICGSEPYIAPEVLAKKTQYDPRALDIWSSAIIMIYLTFGGAIWTRAEPGNLHYDKLVKGWNRWYEDHPSCDACISDTDYPYCYALDLGVNPPALRRLLLQMLNPNPDKRISIFDVLNNRWVKNVECCQIESYDDPSLVIDATIMTATKLATKKIFCHNHLPPKNMGSHTLGKMPGSVGY